MNTGTKIALILLFGVGGYLAYNKFKEKKSTAKDPKDDGVLGDQPKGATNFDAFKDKIKILQKLLDLTVDGVAGPLTMAKVNKYVKVDSLTPENIDANTRVADFVFRAVNSLSANKAASNSVKKEKYTYWTSKAKEYKINFNPFITNAFNSIVGQSIYVLYKEVI